MGSTPQIPWYLYSTANDDVSPIFMTDDLVTKYCAAGADILVSSVDHSRGTHLTQDS